MTSPLPATVHSSRVASSFWTVAGMLVAGLLAGCSLFGSESEDPIAEVQLEGLTWPDPELGLVLEPYAGLHRYGVYQRDYGGSRGRLGISLSLRDERTGWSEGVSFSGAFDGERRYSITLTQDEYRDYASSGNVADVRGALAASFMELNVDYPISLYDVVKEEPGELVVTRYDSSAGVIEGRFRVTLALAYIEDDQPELHGYLHDLPDTLRFTEGRFRVTDINDQRNRR